MIFDHTGRKLRRAVGFLPALTPERDEHSHDGTVNAVGFEVNMPESEDFELCQAPKVINASN